MADSTMNEEETFFNNLVEVNRMASGVKTFRWLIRRCDRYSFVNGRFQGDYFDNGVLYLRNRIPPGTVVTTENRAQFGPLDSPVDLVGRFIIDVEEAGILQQQGGASEEGHQVEPIDPDESITALLENFICPVCMDPCFPPSYICQNSHNLCGKCRDGLLRSSPEPTKCPTCRIETSFTGPYYINAAVAGAFPFKCRYASYGCAGEILGENVVNHAENECIYRPWTCYFCPQLSKISDFTNHLLANHKDQLPLVMKKCMPAFLFEAPISNYNERGRDLLNLGLLYVKGLGAFYLIEMEFRYGVFGWVVTFLGPNAACKKFRADIKLIVEYDIGNGRPCETITEIFDDQPVLSCQNRMQVIFDNIMQKLATTTASGFAMRDFSRYGGAGRYCAVMEVVIRDLSE